MSSNNNIINNSNPLLPDPESSLLLSSSSSSTKLKPSKEFSTRIINHHTKIRLTALGENGNADDAADSNNNTVNLDEEKKAELAWQKMKQDKAALKQYSSDMFNLATQYWKHGNSNNNNDEDQDSSDEDEFEQEQEQEQSSSGKKDSQGITQQNSSKDDVTAKPPKKRFMTTEQKQAIHKNSDRLLYIVESIELYFIGKKDSISQPALPLIRQREDDGNGNKQVSSNNNNLNSSTTKTTTTNTLPALIAAPLKEFKRNSWKNLQRAATSDECDTFIKEYVRKEVIGKLFASPPLPSSSSSSSDTTPVNTFDFTIVDIGSCYNPLRKVFSTSLQQQHQHETDWYKLKPVCIGLDLYPYESRKSGVIQCDWHDVKMTANDERREENRQQQEEEQEGKKRMVVSLESSVDAETQNQIMREHVIAARDLFVVPHQNSNHNNSDVLFIESVDTFKKNSAHVVTFCLMLSYLPSATMRLRCCFNAFHFLKPNGLFIVLSTRTQCNRKSKWEDQWIDSLERIGFERFRKDIRMKMVGMCFRKKKSSDAGDVAVPYYEKFEDIPEDLRKLGLPIRADFM